MLSKVEKERRKKALNKQLYDACVDDQPSRVFELLESGADVNGLVVVAVKDKETALHAACRWQRLDIVAILVSRGANTEATDSDGATALLTAAQWSNLAGVCFLLDREARIDAQNKRGQTALHKAVNNDDIVAELLRRGASLDCVDRFGQTPLHVAAHHGTFNSVSLLLEAGADARLRTVDALSARDIAIVRAAEDGAPCDVSSIVERLSDV